MDLWGEDGGEYCCEVFPATRIACSAAYRAAASTCSTLEGLTDFDRRVDGDTERRYERGLPTESKSLIGDLQTFSGCSRSLLVSLCSCIDADVCLIFLRCLFSSSNSEFAWLDNGERDLDLDADRSLLRLLAFSLA